MKIDLNSIQTTKLNKPSFEGFQHKKSELGDNEYLFNVPHDSDVYDVTVQIFPVIKDDKGDYKIDARALANKESTGKTLKTGGLVVNLEDDYGNISLSNPK